MAQQLTRDRLAHLVDHTLLRPEATAAEVAQFCAEAGDLHVLAVCISPSLLPLPAGVIPPGVRVAAVCGFPSGAHHSKVKAAEAAIAVSDGADEIDMVINVGLAKTGDWAGVQKDIAAVRAATPPPTVLKAILETAVLTDDEIVAACHAAADAGADFVKTSTGFHPQGGATPHAVALMARTVGGRLGVKASGGVRTATDATTMIAAGATRLGLSGTRAVLDGLTPGATAVVSPRAHREVGARHPSQPRRTRPTRAAG
jgi:deoxyribose-phosphate aldolase